MGSLDGREGLLGQASTDRSVPVAGRELENQPGEAEPSAGDSVGSDREPVLELPSRDSSGSSRPAPALTQKVDRLLVLQLDETTQFVTPPHMLVLNKDGKKTIIPLKRSAKGEWHNPFDGGRRQLSCSDKIEKAYVELLNRQIVG